jgi:mono/diheme cytochrome c family protein
VKFCLEKRKGVARSLPCQRSIRNYRHPLLAVCVIILALFTLVLFTACDVQRRKSDAELGLNPQQAAGRQLYDQYCDRCHEPYSSRDKKGHSLKGVFQRQFLPQSGMPANDERVGELVVTGRGMMPAFGQAMSQQQVQDLLAYMHTL